MVAVTGRSPSPTGEPPDLPPEPAPEAGPEEQAERRGRQIAGRLRARARAAGHDELGPDELAIVLETATSLPEDVIERITRPAEDEGPALAREHRATQAEQAQAASLEPAAVAGPPASPPQGQDLAAAGRDPGTTHRATATATAERTAAQVAAESFPHSAADAVTAAAARSAQAAQSPARTTAPRQARHSVRPR
jgi:hypothetical protein